MADITNSIKRDRNLTNYRSFIRFIIVGCINTGVDFIVFTLLKSVFDINYLACQIAGYSMGIINSFIMNKLWTFENTSNRFKTERQFIKFIAINILSLGISLIGLRIFNSHGVNVYLSKVIVTGVTQIINFAGYKLWVFNK